MEGGKALLVKIAYEGNKFHGFQYQPNLKTVQSELFRVLSPLGLKRYPPGASRTDSGVHSLGNVIKVYLDDGEKVCKVITANCDGIIAYAYAEVDENFVVTRAKERHYRYVLYNKQITPIFSEVIKLFEGTHDFREFTKDRENTVRRINRIDVITSGEITFVDFYAKSFLWQMIRRIIGSSLLIREREEMEIIRKALNGEKLPSKYKVIAPPNLILMDVVYDEINFKNADLGISLRNRLLNNFLNSFIKVHLYENLITRK